MPWSIKLRQAKGSQGSGMVCQVQLFNPDTQREDERLRCTNALVWAQSKDANGRINVVSLTIRKCPQGLFPGSAMGFLRTGIIWGRAQGCVITHLKGSRRSPRGLSNTEYL